MTANREPHIGRNIKRIREILQVKQSTLAHALGDDWNQKKVSYLEDKESVDDELLEQVATILKVPIEAIRNFDDEKALNIVSNTFNEGSILNGINYNPIFNPIDKWVEALEENRKLYERLIETEREKVALMERLMAERK